MEYNIAERCSQCYQAVVLDKANEGYFLITQTLVVGLFRYLRQEGMEDNHTCNRLCIRL